MENNKKVYTREEEDKAFDFLMKQIEREEKEAIIDYYIAITGIIILSFVLGYIVGAL